MRTNEQRALFFILITVLIDVIGFGIIIPVAPDLIVELTGVKENEASQYGAYLIVAYSLMQFAFSTFMGNLSDRFGRRPILLISLFGLAIDYLLMAYAPTFSWLIIGRIIAGIGGASFTTAMAYIADISSPEKRAQNFGLIGAAFGIGFIIGPLIGAVFSNWGTRFPFFIAAGLTILNFLYGYFVLPESLPVEKRRKFELKRCNPLRTLIQLKRYPLVLKLVLPLLLVFLASHAVQSNWNYFTAFRFNWDAQMIGYSLGFVGLLVGIVQGGLIRIIIPKLGQKKSIYAGMILYAIGLMLFAFATQGWMMFVFLIPYCLGGITGPALQGLMSNEVPQNEQGELQGSITGLQSLAAIFGPMMMNNTFAYFSSQTAFYYFPGASFALAALLTIVSVIFTMNILGKIK